MILVEKDKDRDFDELIARAKTASNYVETTYVAQKSTIVIALWMAVLFLVLGMGWLTYQVLIGGDFRILSDDVVNSSVIPFVLISISVALLIATSFLYAKMRATLLHLRLSQQRLRLAIERAEQLTSNNNG